MAMMVRRDRSAYYGSLQQNSQAAQGKAATEASKTSAKNDLTLAKRNLRTQAIEEQAWNDTLQVGKNAINAFTTIVSDGMTLGKLISEAQMADANTDLLKMTTEGKGIAEKSIADGSSMFTLETDENGNETAVFSPGEGIETWYQDAMKAIDDSDYTQRVKDSMKQSLTQNYYGFVQNMQSGAIKRSFDSIEQGFETQITADSVSDAQLYAQYDGKLPEGVLYSGMATIAGRSDWTDDQKKAYAAQYIQQVQRQGIQERAVQIATSQGMQSANDYIYSQKSLTAEQKISISSKANAAYQQIENGYVAEVDSMMESAFSDPGGSSPSDVYEWIDNMAAANGLPESMVNKLNDTAKGVQTEAANAAVDNTLASDTMIGIAALESTRTNLANGVYDSWFYGNDELKQGAIAKYDSAITAIKKGAADALGKSLKDIEEMDDRVIDAFNAANNEAFSLFDTGAITGRQYGEMLVANANTALQQSQMSDVEITTAWRTAMGKATDAYVEEVYGDDVRSSVEALLVAEGAINATKSERTKEELQLINDLVAETNGNILNTLWDYGKKKVPIESVLDYADKSYQSFLLKQSVLGKDGETDIPLPTDPGVTMKKVVNAVSESNSKITSDMDASYVWYDHSDAFMQGIDAAADENGQISLTRNIENGLPTAHFLDEGVQEEYRRSVNVYRSQLAMALGISEADLMGADYPEAVGENAAIASPVFYYEGRSFRCRGKTIQEFVDTGTAGDGKGEWKEFAYINNDGRPTVIGAALADDGRDTAPDDAAFSISGENIRDYIKLDTEMGRMGPVVKGVTVDPRIVQAANYTAKDVYSMLKDIPELMSQWPSIGTELRRLEMERDKGKEEG